jgi:uncharacterized membrane protein YgcG
MFKNASIGGTLLRPARRLFGVTLSAALLGLLAALPAAPAQASSPSITPLPSSQAEEVLEKAPLGQLQIPELAEVLSKLPQFSGVSPETVQKAIEEAVAQMKTENPQATLEELLKGGGKAKIEATLKSLVGGVSTLLETLLGGSPAEKIEEALKAKTPQEILGEQLKTSSEPEELLQRILSALNPETLKSLLGSVLSGEPFSKQTVAELASELEMSSKTLAEQVGKTVTDLPETAAAITAPLTDGKDLAAFNGLEGVTLGVVEKGTGALGGTGGSGGGTSGGGGTGGSGGPGAGGTTIVVTVPGSSPSASSPAATAAASAVGKIKILSHKIKGRVLTIVAQVPSAGTLSLSAKDVAAVRRETAKSERVTIQTTLRKAEAASLGKHHRKLKDTFKLSFKPVAGASSSASFAGTFR